MAFETVRIPGVATDISIRSSWTGCRFYVDGVRVRARGLWKPHLMLRGVNGEPVEVRVLDNGLRAYPVLRVGGANYPTGPATTRAWQTLALLPVLAIPSSHPAGLLIAVCGVPVNMAIIRSEHQTLTKALLMCAFNFGALALAVASAIAFNGMPG